MSAEGHDSEHVATISDILQPITSVEPTNGGLNVKDASGHHGFDQKTAGHATEDDADDRAGGAASVDERSGRESPDTVYSDKTMEEQIQRPYEPIAKTLEADKENMSTDTVQEHSHIDLDVAYITEGTQHTTETEPAQPVQESSTLEDHGINTDAIVPVGTDGEAIPSPSPVPSDITSQTHPHVSEPETPATATQLSFMESQLVPVDPSCGEAESASFAPEVENPLPVVETSTAEPAAMDIQLHDTPSREERQAFETETTDVHRSDTRDPEDAQVELASTVTAPEIPVEKTEASPVAAVEEPVFPVESLMTVDATALAATLLEDDREPDVPQPELSTIPAETRVGQQSSADQAEATPEKAPSVKIEDASADSEVPAHESDSAAVHSIGSSAGREEPAADVLSVEKGEDVERPKSPWTPSYSVTTQGPGELNILKNVAESEERENIPLTKESTPEIVVGGVDTVDTAEPAKESGNALDSQAGADAQRHDAEVSTQVDGSTQEDHTTKPQSLAIDVSTSSLQSEEPTEERPKSPWTPSYSVITQGSSPHESAELDQLDQLSPSVIRAVEHPRQGVIDEAVATGLSEPVGVEVSEEADYHIHDITNIQRASMPATDSGSDEASPDAPAADGETSVPQDVEPVLAASCPPKKDTAPQASCNMVHEYRSRYLTLLSVSRAPDIKHFIFKVGR
ncbi:hypothetical protein PILCRDRAFT_378567 [Piloderma croceum F 1598]|uniref:Uncharacterized protein n=1 Tax=Piloderma croceum (strain F 1598) TaxID=765440 RepID=A0A0C3FZ50_PILCF|nr:hypothetical protein PILCRDRAFT_378567 [Piloderma croceum F 1598]